MRKLAAVLTLGVAFSVLPFVQSAQAKPAHVQQVQQKKRGPKGVIASIDGSTVVVTVTNKTTGNKKDRKIKADSNTKFVLDGKECKLADLKAGQTVKVTPGENHGDPASEIDATTATADSNDNKGSTDNKNDGNKSDSNNKSGDTGK